MRLKDGMLSRHMLATWGCVLLATAGWGLASAEPPETASSSPTDGEAPVFEVQVSIGPAPELRSLRGEAVRVRGVPSLVDGRLLGHGDQLIAHVKRQLYTIDLASGRAKSVATSIDAVAGSGALLAVVSGRTVEVLDADMRTLRTVTLAAGDLDGSIVSLSWSGDALRLAVSFAPEDELFHASNVGVFDARSGALLYSTRGSQIGPGALNTDGSVLITSQLAEGAEEGCYGEWEVSAKLVRPVALDDNRVALVFEDRDEYAQAMSDDFPLDAWVVPRPPGDTWRPNMTLLPREERLRHGGFSAPWSIHGPTTWLAAKTTGGVRIFHLASRHMVAELQGQRDVDALAFLENPARLVTVDGSTFQIFALDGVAAPLVPEAHLHTFTCEELKAWRGR